MKAENLKNWMLSNTVTGTVLLGLASKIVGSIILFLKILDAVNGFGAKTPIAPTIARLFERQSTLVSQYFELERLSEITFSPPRLKILTRPL